MNTIVYGGAFAPGTDAHRMACSLALSLADRVIVLPSGQRHDKVVRLADIHRVELLRILVSPFPSHRVEIYTDMLDLPTAANTTANVDRILRSRYGDIAHIFGTDTATDMPRWSEPDYVAQAVAKVFVRRADDAPDLRGLARWWVVESGADTEVRHLSSTRVRERVRRGIYTGLDPRAETYLRFRGINFS